MSILAGHLEQISLFASAISELDFETTQRFTNAILGNHEITTLIRDTEPHERALFSLDPNVTINPTANTSKTNTVGHGNDNAQRRKTLFAGEQRQTSTVAKVLGHDMLRQIQQTSRGRGRSKGVDVEILLQGAERLCSVYSVPGAEQRITALREKFVRVTESVAEHEALVHTQQSRLDRLQSTGVLEMQLDHDVSTLTTEPTSQVISLTEDDMKREEGEIRELEARKKELEERVAEMEKDLGGLLR